MTPSDPTCHVFLPADGVDLPALDGLPGVRSVADAVVGQRVTVCFDTPRLALARSEVGLRHVTGSGSATGWLLDVPSGRSPELVEVPGGTRPPKRLRVAVTAWALGEELTAVATVREATTSHALLDGAGVELAAVTEHRLEADLPSLGAGPSGDGASSSGGLTLVWREWSVRLGEADVALLRAVDSALSEVGAQRVRGPRAATTLLRDAVGEHPRDGAPRPGRPAARVVALRLEEQLRELRERDSEVRRSGLGGVHGLRVALRRTRAALGSFGALLAGDATASLREELGWAARALGASRDSQVVEERLMAVVAAEPASAIVGPVRRRVQSHFGSTRRSARADVAAVLDSSRYLALVAAFDGLVAAPPWTEVAQRPAREVLPSLVLRDWKRLHRRVEAAERASGPEADELLHEARKAAKRLRYAAETVEPVSGGAARRLARRAAKLQSVLGEHQDAVVARQRLQGLVREAGAAGEPTFSYGRLDRALEDQATAGRSALARTARKIARPKL